MNKGPELLTKKSIPVRLLPSIFGVFAMASVLCASQQSKPGFEVAAQEDTRPAWTEFLRDLAKNTGATLIVQVDPKRSIPVVNQDSGAFPALADFASFTFADVRDKKGIQLITRKPHRLTESTWRKAQLIQWLSQASDEELLQLMSGEFSGDQLPDSVRKDVLPLFTGTDSLWKAICSGAPFAMSANLAFSIEFTDKEGRQQRFRLSSYLPDRLKATSPRFDFKPKKFEHDVTKDDRLIPRPVSGPIDFGEGELLTLRQLSEKILQMTGKRLTSDPRLAESLIFVNGSMTMEDFSLAFADLTTALPGGEVQASLDQESAISELLAGAFGRLVQEHGKLPPGVELEDVIQGKSVTIGTLLPIFPQMKGDFDAMGLSGNSTVKFIPGVQFAARPGSDFPVGQTTRADGKPLTIGARPNITVVVD